MSFIITLCVPEGIVMASDSRSMGLVEKTQGNKKTLEMFVQTDSMCKTFLAPGRIGISTSAAADIQRKPISFYLESFVNDQLSDKDCQVDEVAKEILKYFRRFPGPPSVNFLVAGYKRAKSGPQSQLWRISVKEGTKEWLNKDCPYGYAPAGVADTFSRLTEKIKIHDRKTGEFKDFSYYEIDWSMFTLQDAIDYAIYATKMTIDTMRFQRRAKTVGGPIDVLVIKPEEAFWVQSKELKAEDAD